MLRKTYSILAVAITASASAACGGTTTEPSTHQTHQETKQELAAELANTTLADALARRDHFAPLCDGDGYPLPGNVNNKEGPRTTVTEFCNAIKPPAPTPDAGPDATSTCDLNALNMELSTSFILDDAVTQRAHFRCLCDDQGYPLVGNINGKGASASQFCAALKEKGLL